ncbi:MAG: oligoribonuclease [Candidatus Nanopelagicaceae bacterium]|jgi:oligoribonuclease
MANENPPLVWVDCEMTGLDLTKDALIEIAVLVTDENLNILGDGIDLTIQTDSGKLDGMSPEVRGMHTESGLLEKLKDGVEMSFAEEQIITYLSKFTSAGKSPIAGNSIGMDRNFINRDMPRLGAFLHYRSVDVSSIKELARRWYPKVYFNAPKKTGNHRALGDIQDSIAELRYYRENIFISNS